MINEKGTGREKAEKQKEKQRYFTSSLLSSLAFSFLVSLLALLIKLNFFIVFAISFILLALFFYFRVSLKEGARIKIMENMFPDVIQIMSSNLRAGMTIDRAFLLSARPEFLYLNDEIVRAGREIATGKDIGSAMKGMSRRIGSEKIDKTINLIMSGIKSGGNISTLLEQTASYMREKEFIEKRAASSVLMYVIFIFSAVAFGAPLLFGMSSVLVDIIVKIGSTMPSVQAAQIGMPFTFSALNLSQTFILYFTLIFLVVSNIISSLVIGLVSKGDEKFGLRFMLPLIALSIFIFFAVRFFLMGFLSQTFALS
ncbi:MAG TPA: type II secretion system F family protein, partial [Candidatus Nanoarchaeia archaeon]|nr:type II secretion system F family protein [Candidatus Nanoarchaeia archaeon]